MPNCPPPALRINISHRQPDAQLTETLDVIQPPHDEIRVTTNVGTNGVDGAVKATLLRMHSPGFVMLDLIAHATSDGILQLGDWAVSDGIALVDALKKLPNLRLCGIRLLGCNTAATEAGKEAIIMLAAQFRTCVWGTIGPIGSGHFKNDGFSRDDILQANDEITLIGPGLSPSPSRRPEIPSDALRREWLRRFPLIQNLTLDQAITTLPSAPLPSLLQDRALAREDLRWPVREISSADFEALFACVASALVEAPGLLAVPDLEFVSETSNALATSYRRATLVLGGAFLRIHPTGRPHPILLRVSESHDSVVKSILARSNDALLPRRRIAIPRPIVTPIRPPAVLPRPIPRPRPPRP